MAGPNARAGGQLTITGRGGHTAREGHVMNEEDVEREDDFEWRDEDAQSEPVPVEIVETADRSLDEAGYGYGV